MTLQYPKISPLVKEIEARLIELSLAFKTKKTSLNKTIVLIDGKQIISGEKAILNHLDEVQGELHHWHYCAC